MGLLFHKGINNMDKEFLEAGKIVSTHGIKGEMRVQPWSDDSSFLKDFKILYFDSEGKKSVGVESARAHGTVTLLKLQGVDSIEDAESLRGKIIYINKADKPLSEGEYYVNDIIGLKIIDESNGELLGTVKGVESYPANDVWKISCTDGREVLIPNVPVIVKKVVLSEGNVYIYKMKGLFDDED